MQRHYKMDKKSGLRSSATEVRLRTSMQTSAAWRRTSLKR